MNIQNNHLHNKRGTVLIMSVAVIVLIVSLATAYLKAVSPQRGAGKRQVMQRMANNAANSAQAHAIAAILDDHNNLSYTSDQGRWRQDFFPVAADNTLVQPWEFEGATAAVRTPAYDDDLNVLPENRITYMMSLWALDAVPVYSSGAFHRILGAPNDYSTSTRAGNPVSRWHNLDYLDKNLLSIFDSSPDEATALNDAQFIMRYSVEVLDADSHININPDYPQFLNIPSEPNYDSNLPNYPMHYDVADPDNTLYLKRQSYINRFARSIKSMHSTRDARASNLHQYLYGYSHTDTERVEIASDGGTRGNSKADHLIASHRHASENFFRGDVTRWDTWANSEDNKQQTFIYAGNVHSPWTIPSVFDGAGTMSASYSTHTLAQLLTPYGAGMRDHSWDENNANSWLNGSSANNPNVPWRINLLTAPLHVRSHMLLGLSSHLMFEENLNGGRSSPYDLFGHHYPDAFPLSLDDGRHVRFIGGDRNGAERIDFGFSLNTSTDANGTIFRPSRNSYWWDTVAALGLSIEVAQKVYNYRWSPVDDTVAQGSIYDPDCLLDINETDPAVILQLVEKDWLRILGEDYDNPSAGLLASLEHGNKRDVGYGDTASKMSCRLEPGSNTRGMEFLLNDLRMSFFGSSALNFNGDDANDDGVVNVQDAESTRAGWWHNGTRMWSWWWDGVPRTSDSNNEWMTNPTWYRMWYGDSQMNTPYSPGAHNRIARWTGTEWVEYIAGDTEFDDFLEINKPFINDPDGNPWSASNPPIKPWSATGRFFVGHSNLFRILVRGQIYDNITAEHAAEINFESTFAVIKDNSGNMDDSHILYKRYHINKNAE